jgi:hypothetical protein
MVEETVSLFVSVVLPQQKSDEFMLRVLEAIRAFADPGSVFTLLLPSSNMNRFQTSFGSLPIDSRCDAVSLL